jgi:hypothetical protein
MEKYTVCDHSFLLSLEWSGSSHFQEWTKLAADAHESMLQLAVFQIRAAALPS